MFPLLYILLAFAVTALAVTVYAILTAPDGFEDALGFHALCAADGDNRRSDPGSPAGDHRAAEDLPLATAR